MSVYIMTTTGWRAFWVKAEVPSDHPSYTGDHGPTLSIQDPWADKLNRAARKRNQEGRDV